MRPSSATSILLIALSTALLTPDAFFSAFGAYKDWDDEGYILSTIDHYVNGGRSIYTGFFTQYGPFFYIFHDIIFSLFHLPVTGNIARWLSIALLLLSCCTLAVFVHLRTSSLSLAISTQVLTYIVLTPILSDPCHPVNLVVFLLSFLPLAALNVATSTGLATRLFSLVVIACVICCLGLTKINIGAYALIAFLFIVCFKSKTCSSLWRGIQCAFYAALPALPVILMKDWLTVRWIQVYIAIFISSALWIICLRESMDACCLSKRHLLFILCFGTIVACAICIYCMNGGTGPWEMLVGVVIEPIHHPSRYLYGTTFGNLAIPYLIFINFLSACLFIAFCRGPVSSPGALPVPFALLLPYILFLVLVAAKMLPFDFLLLSIPSLWMFAAGCRHSSAPGGSLVVLFLVTQSLMQSLHGFPMYGSQASAGLVFVPCLIMIGLHDLLPQILAMFKQSTFALSKPNDLLFIKPLLLAYILLALALRTGTSYKFYNENVPIGLPGMALVRVPPSQAGVNRALFLNARHFIDILTLPGRCSLNLWTGIPPVSTHLSTVWYELLSDQEQTRIFEKVSRSAMPFIIVNCRFMKGGVRPGIVGNEILDRWLNEATIPIAFIQEYELRTLPGFHEPLVNVFCLDESIACDRGELEPLMALRFWVETEEPISCRRVRFDDAHPSLSRDHAAFAEGQVDWYRLEDGDRPGFRDFDIAEERMTSGTYVIVLPRRSLTAHTTISLLAESGDALLVLPMVQAQ